MGITEVTIEVGIMERRKEALTLSLYHYLTLILRLHQIQREDLRPMPKLTMPIMATIRHGTLDITIPDTCMERKSEVLTQNLHQNLIQREDLKPTPKPGMPIMDTTQHGIPDIIIHTGAITTMERKREALMQREDLKPMLKPGMLIMDTTQHGIPDITTTHT